MQKEQVVLIGMHLAMEELTTAWKDHFTQRQKQMAGNFLSKSRPFANQLQKELQSNPEGEECLEMMKDMFVDTASEIMDKFKDS